MKMRRLSKKEIGDKIRALRESMNLDQSEMAYKIGAYQSAISKWERGENLPTGANRQALCDFLGLPWKTLAFSDESAEKDAKIKDLNRRLEALEKRLSPVSDNVHRHPDRVFVNRHRMFLQALKEAESAGDSDAVDDVYRRLGLPPPSKLKKENQDIG